MPLTIQPLIDLANTDLELQTNIFSRTHLERQIDTARSVVDQHQKLFEQKNGDISLLNNEGSEVKKNIQIQEQLIVRLDEQVPKIRNEKEFAASKSQLEEARKLLGMLEEKMLELDMKKEDLDQEVEAINTELSESNSAFQEKTAGLLIKHEKVETAETIFGQIKILISFLQIMSSMPTVMESVPWPEAFLSFSVILFKVLL